MYADAMAQLQAEESLHATTVAALGSGNVKKAQHRKITSDWRRIAERGRRSQKVSNPAEFLAGLGFAVEVKHRG